MESFYRLADAISSINSPPRSHHDLGCRVFPAFKIWHSFFVFGIFINDSAYDHVAKSSGFLRGNEPVNKAIRLTHNVNIYKTKLSYSSMT